MFLGLGRQHSLKKTRNRCEETKYLLKTGQASHHQTPLGVQEILHTKKAEP
jgi:hypothetical protein